MTRAIARTDPAEDRSSAADRRRHRRVAVALPGRYLLEDGSEHSCECMDISANGLRIRAAKVGPWGSRVVVYIDGVGRMDGHLVRRAPGWFAIESHASVRKENRVEERIAWIEEAKIGKGEDRRRLSRKYVERQPVRLATRDGTLHPATIADISQEGAALLTEAKLDPGEPVRLDGRRARVVRAFPGGLALKFENWASERPKREVPLAPPI